MKAFNIFRTKKVKIVASKAGVKNMYIFKINFFSNVVVGGVAQNVLPIFFSATFLLSFYTLKMWLGVRIDIVVLEKNMVLISL